ncbi:hypothetical protein ETC01_09105 [Geobacillus sp. NFOSA3]|nr:hypothetical protein [Geobacillus sp. NFOSA3]
MQTTKNNNSNSSYYQALDFFMLRTPVFPLEKYIKIFSQECKKQNDNDDAVNDIMEHFIALADDPVFREAIAVASLPLYESLDELKKRDTKKAKQVFYSVLNYYIRMSMRPTPFGLFSGVSLGYFGDETDITLNKQYLKRARPDMQWLCNVVKLLEQDFMLLPNLSVHANHLLYRHGDRMILPYLSHHGTKQDSAIDNAVFKITPVIEDVLSISKSPIKFSDLVSMLSEKYQGVPKEKIVSYLRSMIDKDFLITDLRPPLLGKSPFNYVLQKVKSLHPNPNNCKLYNQLVSIYQSILEYNQSKLGEGEKLYIQLTKEMMGIVKTKNTLQVDLKMGAKEVKINKRIKQDIEEAAEILWRISTKRRGAEHIRSYYNDFVENYGYYSEIPILELLDSSLGIGAPPTYLNPPSSKTVIENNSNPKRDFILFSWISECLALGEQKILLTDQMIKELEIENQSISDAPDSFELYFTLAGKSRDAIDRGEYTLVIGPNVGSFGAGKTFGRFVDVLGDRAYKNIKNVYETEQKLNPDAIFVEVSYLPSSSRVANVMIVPSIREYEIAIGTNSSKACSKTLPLSDIVVGASQDRLYLKSKSLGKEIIPVTGHMVNHINGVPNIYRFLIDIGLERQSHWEPFNWGGASQLPFLPRIQYEKTILSLATWRFNKLMYPFNKVQERSDWDIALNKWREIYRVPRYINLTDFDNRILLDLDNKVHRQVIFNKFSKLDDNNFLVFTELGFSFKENWVTSEENNQEHFIMEGVFPVVKTSGYREGRGKNSQDIRKEYIPKSDRSKTIGSDWLYLKLYGPSDRLDELIYSQIREFCQRIQTEELAKYSFFMRYADPKSHVRLRFHGDPQTLLCKLLPLIHEWVENLQRQGLVDDLLIDTYKPEIERYGGRTLITLAEKMFAFDSKVSADIIAWRELEGKNFNKNLIAVISVVSLLEASGLSIEKQLEWLNKVVPNRKQSKEFRENRKLFTLLANPEDDWKNLKKHKELYKLYDILSQRKDVTRQYFNQVYSTDIAELTNHPDDILGSVIHLHLNRLGFHGEEEENVMTLTKHTLQSLFFRKKCNQ